MILSGIDYSRIKKNPSIKRDHSINADDSVGRIISLEVVGDELRHKSFISSTEQKIIKKIKDGVIVDLSIGFIGLERDKIDPRKITKWILHEISLTGIGMLNEARITEKKRNQELSFKNFKFKNMEKKETAEAVVETKSFSKEEVDLIVEKAVEKTLEKKSFLDEQSKVEKAKKEFKEERMEKKSSVLAVETKSFNAEDKKRDFYTKMFKHRGQSLNGNQEAANTLLSLKSMNGLTDSAGGYAIPTDMNKELLVDVMNEAFMLPMVSQFITKGRTIEIPIAENATPNPTPTDEGAERPTSDGVLREVSVNVYNISCKTTFSNELLADAEYDLISTIISILNQNAALQIDTQILNGGGDVAKEMEGIFTNVNIPTVDMIDEVDFDKIREGVDTLPVRYRKVKRQKSLDSRGDMLAFVIGTTSKTFLRGLKDLNGRYLWQESVAGAEFPTLDGYPVVEVDDSFVPANSMLFGNFKKGYAAVIRNSGQVQESMHYRFAYNETMLRFEARVGGKVLDSDAFVIFENVGQVTP